MREISGPPVSRSISSKPRSQSLTRNSSGKISTTSGLSGRHSFVAPLRMPDPTEFNDALDLEENAQKVQSALKKAPIGRLFYLNKPEAFVLNPIVNIMFGIAGGKACGACTVNDLPKHNAARDQLV